MFNYFQLCTCRFKDLINHKSLLLFDLCTDRYRRDYSSLPYRADRNFLFVSVLKLHKDMNDI